MEGEDFGELSRAAPLNRHDLDPKGASIESGASDWQVFQRGPDGTGRIDVTGHGRHALPGAVQGLPVE